MNIFILCLSFPNRECPPPEFREAVSTMIFAAVWYPDLPELCDLRHIFAERYGNFFEHFVGQEVRKNMSLALHALVCLISLQVFAKKTVKFSVLDAMGLSSKPLHSKTCALNFFSGVLIWTRLSSLSLFLVFCLIT
jgi:hypothetical protein